MSDHTYDFGLGRVRPNFGPISDLRQNHVSAMLRHRAASFQSFALFSGIPLSDCIEIVARAHERHFFRRQTIFFEGDQVRLVILLISGCVKITQLGPNGHEVILRLGGIGEVLGGVGLCGDCEHCSTARTMQDSTALVWEAAQFEALADEFPHLSRNVAHSLEMRLIDLQTRFREISTEKVSLRLSSQLLRLSSQIGKKENGHIEITLSRRDLAQLTGTTLFTVSRLLCRWESKGIVTAKREAVLIHNLPALVELSREE